MDETTPAGTTTVVTFLAAAGYAGSVLASPAVAAAWGQPSALPQMTVGAVAGHMFLVVRRVDKHLDAPEPPATGPRALDAYRWLRVERAEDLDRADHRTVRADGEHVASWGWPAVHRAYVDRIQKLSVRLAERSPVTVALPAGVIDFATYLATRVVELLVHADDLATSVALEPAPLPGDAATLALELLLDASRSIHGDRDVLRAFTRAERIRPPIPSVY